MVLAGETSTPVLVPDGTAVPWSTLITPPTVPTFITFDNNGGVAPGTVTGGEIIIDDTGYFLVTVGLMPDPNTGQSATPMFFNITVNGATAQNAIITYLANNASGVFTMMSGITLFIQATTTPTYLQVVNQSGVTATLNNAARTTGSGPAAYVTLMKLHP